MKRFWRALLFFSLIPFAMCTCFAATERVVYVSDGGTGDGTSANAPLGTLEKAYEALGPQGGRIVICGTLTMKGAFEEPVHTGTVYLTQFYNDIDYRADGALYTGGSGRRFILNGPTVFEDIRLRTTNKAGLLIIAQYNPIIIGEGVRTEGFEYSLVNHAATVVGGCQNGLSPLADAGTDASITVKSGTFLIVGFNRQMRTDCAGTAQIAIYGGEIAKLYGGSINGGTGASVEILIEGGKFTGALACDYGIAKSVKLTVNGGDFSERPSITGVAETSEITLAATVEETVKPLISGFSTIRTDAGVTHRVYKVAEDVFDSGSFTDSNGVTVPYRIYFPDGYDRNADKTYPVFFYFHGNGSRGTDNKAQLSASHPIVSKVLNSGTDCIIVAPQCPASSAWIAKSAYPGGTGFHPATTPESPYLAAAIELFNRILTEEKVDTSRIYVSGGSNGAAACWSLIAHNPETVAAAIIFAGTGSTGGANAIANYYLTTPIWTFHGDVDTTLNVAGTRSIVKAVETLGGDKMIYTEMPGYSHNIWTDAANYGGLLDWMFAQTRPDANGVFALYRTSTRTVVQMTVGENTASVNGIGQLLDAAPVIRQSRTMLPVRFVAENLGATVEWDGATSTATLIGDRVTVRITVGSEIADVNGNPVRLDSPAFIESNRTYLPVRFVAEVLGAHVDWNGTTSTATLIK